MLAIFFGVFITTFIVIMAVIEFATGDSKLANERLNRYIRRDFVQRKSAEKPAGRIAAKWRAVVRYLGQYADKIPKVQNYDDKMQLTGIPLKGSEFIVISLGLAILSGLLVLSAAGSMLSAMIAGLVVYFMMLMYINIKISQRLAAFNNQLGDALSLLANALRSGFSFFQAVDMVAKEMKPPISQEFSRMVREMSLGATTEDALNSLAERVQSSDLELVVTAVIVQRQVGGNLAQVLDNISSTIRERIMMKREIKALTAQGRLSGWIVGLLPIVLAAILFVLNPNYVGMLFSDPVGQMLIVGGIISQLVGVLIIRRIINIDM